MAQLGQDEARAEESVEETKLDQVVAQGENLAEETKADQPTDPDEIEEAAALKALADEEAAEKAARAGASTTKTDDQAAPAAEPEADKKPGPMIPKAAFDERMAKKDHKIAELAAAAAYWRGQADAAKAVATKPADEPEAPTPQQQIAGIRGQIKALARDVDDGKLTMSDFEDKRQALLDQELAIREVMQKPVQAEQPRPNSDLFLEQKTSELEGKHPYVPLLSEDDMVFLTRKAVAALAGEGIQLPRGELSPRDQLLLRSKVAELSDTFGPALTGKTLQSKPTPANDGRPALSKEAQNLKQKLQAAQDAPPDLTAAGRGGAPMEYTDAQINAMSQEELDALPMSVLEKIMARQAQ